MGDSDSDYEFGSAEDELARLELQGRALAPATRMIFAASGIRAGMRVLDLGCGRGDVVWTAAPLIERTRVATAQEIGVETFAQRLRDELQRNSAVFAHPILLSAWATTSPDYGTVDTAGLPR